MARNSFRSLVTALVLLLGPQVAAAQTGDEILDKTIAALGGKAALAKVTSRLASGSITIGTPVGNVDGTVELAYAVPNKLRSLTKAKVPLAGQLVVDQRFDGKIGYVLDSLRGNRDVTGFALDNLRNGTFPHPLYNYKELGSTARLLGKEKVGDRDALVVVLAPAKGPAFRYYLDAETYLPLKTVAKIQTPNGQEVERIDELSDFRAVDGVKVAFKVKSSSPVQTFSMQLTKVENNVAIDEALFTKPPSQ
jgi:outer membrane lipoprotein-sorting protein